MEISFPHTRITREQFLLDINIIAILIQVIILMNTVIIYSLSDICVLFLIL